jgi:predicted metal-dependent hydrolase
MARRKLRALKIKAGDELPLLGQKIRVFVEVDRERKRNRVTLRGDVLDVQVGARRDVSQAVEKWYRKQAGIWFEEVVTEYARVVKGRVTRIVISDFKSQWASCSAKGRLAFSWRLMLLPEEIARYVAVHEVAHLKELNHSKSFWEWVEVLDPKFKQHKKWLRENEKAVLF